MDKVVLARATDLHFSAPLNAGAIVAASRRINLNCFHFLMAFSSQQAFFGATPERLWRRRGALLRTEALAGTIRRSGDEAADAALAAELLADSKNRLENRLVHADILSRLAPLTTDATLTEPRILKLRLLQHLKCDIEAELKPGVCDWQLLADFCRS